MTRAAPLLGAVLLLACRSAPRPMYGPAELAACKGAKAEARAGLPKYQACSADLDCVPWSTLLLGCDGVVARGAAPEGVEQALWNACSGVPARALSCPGKIPACLEGRCGYRQPSRVGCEDAIRAYRTRLDAGPNACETDGQCAKVVLRDGTEVAATTTLVAALAREAYVHDDACSPQEAAFMAAGPSPRCVDHACRLTTATPVTECTKPRVADRGCVGRALDADLLRPFAPTTFQVKFAVRRDGRPAAFGFSRPLPDDLEVAVANAVLSCRWEPGTCRGEPVSIWVVLPIRIGR
ncbi:energy transducer TonB [Anaeromyxobacter oryzae]|uniref:TonB C-terminal domain-containing protein n=1 Tax=Anaeromyxobacter oryzae TaxID=2918170 RepID=A0ABN6MS21_9BACT|nr:energy transducer TonB [Anaeromyxobacter oryzae]BDG03770.1 hypothetical protein AMOR_27660 [Anaeromyxobacter oryzae]